MFESPATPPPIDDPGTAAYERIEAARSATRDIERRRALAQFVPRISVRLSLTSSYASRVIQWDAVDAGVPLAPWSERLGWTFSIRLAWPIGTTSVPAVIAIAPDDRSTESQEP